MEVVDVVDPCSAKSKPTSWCGTTSFEPSYDFWHGRIRCEEVMG